VCRVKRLECWLGAVLLRSTRHWLVRKGKALHGRVTGVTRCKIRHRSEHSACFLTITRTIEVLWTADSRAAQYAIS
jgi:hypothetical protein